MPANVKYRILEHCEKGHWVDFGVAYQRGTRLVLFAPPWRAHKPLQAESLEALGVEHCPSVEFRWRDIEISPVEVTHPIELLERGLSPPRTLEPMQQDVPVCQPVASSQGAPQHIVVMGAGDWAKRYAAALKPYVERRVCHVILCYDSHAGQDVLSPKAYHRYLRLTLSNVVEFESWGNGFECWDVADQQKRDALETGQYDTVFIVTPDDTHCLWTGRFLLNAQRIVVEKPFDASTSNIDALLQKLSKLATQPEVWGFDHYLVRAHQFMLSGDYFKFIEFLGGDIQEFHFRMLEATEGGMRDRAPSLQKGLIFDMASHAPALVLPFGIVESIQTTEVKAAMYQGAQEYMRAQPGLTGGRETFAAIKITFTSAFSDQPVRGEIRVGKNVGTREEKYVEVTGINGKKLRLDLTSYIVDLIDESSKKILPVSYLFADPIALLVRETLNLRRTDRMDSLFLPDKGRVIVEKLEEWYAFVTQRLMRSPLDFYDPNTLSDTIVSDLSPLP